MIKFRRIAQSAITFAFVLAALSFDALGDDWPQWRGPNRDEVSRESNLLQRWPDEGPPRVWLNNDAGLGYSGPAVIGNRIYLMGSRKSTEYLIALDANTGKEIWHAELGQRYDNNWGNGPRATPTVDGDYVYAMSGFGDLVCAAANDGKVVWHVGMEELGGSVPQWGFCESVLVDGDRVICTPGGERGALVALDKHSGKILWQSPDIDLDAHYSSPMIMTVGDQRMIVQLFPEMLVGVDPETGKLLWKADWNGRIAVIPTPIVSGNSVYVSSGYGSGCMRVDVTRNGEAWKAQEVFRNVLMKNHHGGVLLVNGHLYGFSDGVGWLCQSLTTGDEVWKERTALGKGAVACADGKLYCLEEDTGVVALVDATPDGWREHSRFTLSPQTRHRKPSGKIWTHPVISNGRLYLRDQELFYCYDISAAGSGSRQ